MSDTDDEYVLFALMSAASATTFITLVTDADVMKRKHRPRRKHAVWLILKYLCRRDSRVLRHVHQLDA